MKEMDQSELKDRISSFFSFTDLIFTVYEDGKYFTVPEYEFLEIIKEIKSEDLEYVSDRFDCDNFAGYFKNIIALKYGINSVGKVLDYWNKHSYNLVVLNNEVLIYEPQTDQLFKDRYKFSLGLLII